MRVKEYWITLVRNMYFQLKGIGIFVLVPLIGLYFLIPLSNWLTYQFYRDVDILYMSILKECQFYIPLLSVWYLLFLLEHLVEEPGHELLYVGGWNKLPQLLLPYGGFLVLMLPLFAVYTWLFPNLWWLYLKLAVIQFLYLAAVYMLAYSSGKIVFCVMGVLCYTIYVIMGDTMGIGVFSYLRLQQAEGLALLMELKGFLAAGGLLLGAGLIWNYYFPERNR